VEIRGKKLDDAQVAIARERLERNRLHRNNKIKLTFDELLDDFANDCMTFTAIAGSACEDGFTKERIRQVYNEYFRDLFPTKRTGRRRRKICRLKRIRIATKNALADFSDDQSLAKIARAAIAAGCMVERTVSNTRGGEIYLSRRMLSINGLRYNISHPHTPIDHGGILYLHCTIAPHLLNSTNGIIILQEIEGFPERIFVLPSRDFEIAYNCGQKRFYIYIPLERRPTYKNHVSRIDWWKYENAWPLALGE